MNFADVLGKRVRDVWVRLAEQRAAAGEAVKPSNLVPWESLNEADREVDRRIGQAVYDLVHDRQAMSAADPEPPPGARFSRPQMYQAIAGNRSGLAAVVRQLLAERDAPPAAFDAWWAGQEERAGQEAARQLAADAWAAGRASRDAEGLSLLWSWVSRAAAANVRHGELDVRVADISNTQLLLHASESMGTVVYNSSRDGDLVGPAGYLVALMFYLMQRAGLSEAAFVEVVIDHLSHVFGRVVGDADADDGGGEEGSSVPG